MPASVLLLADAILGDVLAEAFRDERLRVRSYTSLPLLASAVATGRGDLAVIDPPEQSDLVVSHLDDESPVSITDLIPTIILSTYAWTRRHAADELHALAIVDQPADLESLCRLVSRAANAANELRLRQRRIARRNLSTLVRPVGGGITECERPPWAY
jgi:hypothetical protein